jgi:hypothetical protein
LETVIMNPRLAAMAGLCREVAIPASVLAFAAFGSAGIDNIGAAPIVDRLAPLLRADATFADRPPPIKSSAADDVVAAGRSIAEAPAADPRPVAREPGPVVTAALTDSSEMLLPETPPDQAAKTNMATREPDDAVPAVGSIEVLDECFVIDPCIDRYLWTLYQRTPKEDAIKTQDRRKVTVKKRGKLVTITKTFTTLADEDRDFKLKLFQMLHAAERAGLSPGITSAFRDDYRQSIASGLKAANDRSYHGGSFRGGYGHGLAADIVSVNGATRAQRLASSQTLWNWIDAHGKEFGIGRPYLDRDPPHVAPIDGKEYADHHRGMKARQARLAATQARFARRSKRVEARENSKIV